MTIPVMGVTHDLILHVNDSEALGIVIRPHSFRVDHQPDFIAQISMGDPTGQDTSRWKSFVQQSFFQGAGQYFWSSAHANAGFAESNMWDIARPVTIDDVVLQYDPSWQYGENLAPTGQAQIAVMPHQMTAGGLDVKEFSADWPAYLFEMSGNPHIVHRTRVYVYTCHPESRTWAQNLTSPAAWGGTGKWVRMAQCDSLVYPVIHATMFSGVFICATYDHQIRVVNNSGAIKPAYSTYTDKVAVYDAKIWRSYKGQVAYLDPADNTSPWSTYYSPVDANIPIVNMKTFGGRLYFGTETHLAVFDAGVVYPVQSWEQERSASNFKLMVNHYGALYFNIGNKLMRYTGSGVIEQIRTPVFNNDIIAGVSIGSDLIFLVQGEGVYQTWVFNADTGGCYQWFTELKQLDVDRTVALADAPNMLDALRGRVFIAPIYFTGQAQPTDVTIAPIAIANRVPESDLRSYPGASLVTSSFDFGRPAMDKQYKRIVLDHRMDKDSFIDVDVSVSPRQLPRMAGAIQAQEIVTMQHSTFAYASPPTSLDTGKYLAYFLTQQVQDLALTGVVYMTPSDVTATFVAQYTGSTGWKSLPTSAMEGTSNPDALDLRFDMFKLTDWVSGPKVPNVSQYFYGMRFRYLPIVPAGNTLTITGASQSVVTFAEILRVEGAVVLGDDGKLSLG